MLFVGCVSTKDLAELHKLPQGTQYYGGSFLYNTWVYMGSTNEYHYFKYTYPNEAALNSIDFRIPQNQLVLEFESQYPKDKNEWVVVSPIRSTEQHILGFERTISIYDRDLSPDMKLFE